jgi:hypothetical protein
VRLSDFYKKLEEIAPQMKWFLSGKAIRARFPYGKRIFCPITLVDFFQNNKYLPTTKVGFSRERLNINSYEGADIICSADNFCGASKETRRRLLKIAGLTSEN